MVAKLRCASSLLQKREELLCSRSEGDEEGTHWPTAGPSGWCGLCWGSGHQESLSVTSLTFHVAPGPVTATLRSLRSLACGTLLMCLSSTLSLSIPSQSRPIPSCCFFHTNAPALPANYYGVLRMPFSLRPSSFSFLSIPRPQWQAGQTHTGQNRGWDGKKGQRQAARERLCTTGELTENY